MKKNQKGFGLVEIFFILLIVIAVGTAGWLIFSRQSSRQVNTTKQTIPAQFPTPTSVKAAADTYILSKVGKTNFSKYYTFDKSSYANPKDSTYDFMAYHFSPMQDIQPHDDIVMVQVNRNNLREVYANFEVPDCIKDASLCNFNITRQEAIVIARQNGITASDTTVGWSGKTYKGLTFVISASSCSQKKEILVDYRNGDVIAKDVPHCNID